ncbi:E3 ubiquitin-protein ligase RNF180 [Ambystoma mexicanum]|uniref:E3 ubiquitin-protein ligase RNF180 n=1 Tax=Ambystoma mexicanum TaxID=8296 RepID=UPI0037E70E45
MAIRRNNTGDWSPAAPDSPTYIKDILWNPPTSITHPLMIITLGRQIWNRTKAITRMQQPYAQDVPMLADVCKVPTDVPAMRKWEQTSNSNLGTDDENENNGEKERHSCAVCLDVYFNPYMCYPCHHIFCEPCLRTLAKDNPSHTPCPLCRTPIARVIFQTELNKSTICFFPNEYLKRKHTFKITSYAKCPLPSCRKVFRVFGGFSRRRDPLPRRQFPHGAHRLDPIHPEEEIHGWRFDPDMVIIYIFSINWTIGFLLFCFLCYFFLSSF